MAAIDRPFSWRKLTVCAVALVIIVLGAGATAYQVEGRIDPVTGSTKQTIRLLGISLGGHVVVSPLEARLTRSGILWSRSWGFLYNTHHNLFGFVTCNECGSTSAIYQLGPVLDEFAAGATDSELREFVRTMQTGGDPEQRAAVEAAGERAMQRLLVASPRGAGVR